jgi:hypothetical protein
MAQTLISLSIKPLVQTNQPVGIDVMHPKGTGTDCQFLRIVTHGFTREVKNEDCEEKNRN